MKMRGAFAIVSLLIPFIARAVTDTWDGGGANNLITLNENWLDDTAPLNDIDNTNLIFAGVIRPTPVLGAGFSTRGVTFDNTAGPFTISGQTLTVGVDGIVNNDSETMTFENLVRFSAVADATIHAAAGGLPFTNTVTLPSTALQIKGAAPTSFVNLSGTATLDKTDTGTMTWAPNAAIGLDLTIAGGVVTMAADGTVDLFNSTSTIAVNVGTFNINESLTLDGARLTRAANLSNLNLAAGKTLTVQNGGDAVITGAFTNDTASTIAVTGAGSTFSTTGALSLGGGSTTTISADGDLSTGTGAVFIGNNGNSTVTVTGSGSTFTGGNLNVRGGAGFGTLTFSSGSSGTFNAINLDNSTAGS